MPNKVTLFVWPWKQLNILHAHVCRCHWKGLHNPFGKVLLLNAKFAIFVKSFEVITHLVTMKSLYKTFDIKIRFGKVFTNYGNFYDHLYVIT